MIRAARFFNPFGGAAAPRIIQDALRDLELIRAADVEGLEPVFELLESALA